MNKCCNSAYCSAPICWLRDGRFFGVGWQLSTACFAGRAQIRPNCFSVASHVAKTLVKRVVRSHHNPRVGGSNPSAATLEKPFDVGVYRIKGLSLCAARFSMSQPKWTDLPSEEQVLVAGLLL